MIRKSLKAALSIMFIMFAFMGISCNNEVILPQEEQIDKPLEEKKDKNVVFDEDGGEGKLVLGFHMPWDDGKILSSNHDNSYEYFLLSTEYLSERRDGSSITGIYDGLKIKAEGGEKKNIDLGWFTQGKWKFSVKAANKSGEVLYVGSWTGYISASAANSIVISMEENNEGSGTLQLEAKSVRVAMPRLIIKYTKIWNGDGEHTLIDTAEDSHNFHITSEDVNGYVSYDTDMLTLPAGAYMLKIQLWSGDTLFSGEILDTFIVSNKNTLISGAFTITGLADFIRVMPSETITFTGACNQYEFESGTILTGYKMLGSQATVEFPYTNTTAEVQYIQPDVHKIEEYFTYRNGVVSCDSYPFDYIAFNGNYSDSPKEIAAGTFRNKTTLKGVYGPNIVSIGDEAFMGTALNDTLFGTIDRIGDRAFKDSMITDFDNSAFANTLKIGAGAFENSSIKYMDIPSGSVMGASAFKNAKNLYRVTVLLDDIPESAFEGCSILVDVILKNTKTIGRYAFRGDSKMHLVELSEGLLTIGDEAFNGCSSMIGILNIPESVKDVRMDTDNIKYACGRDAFKGTSGLSEIFVNAMCHELGQYPWGATCPITWKYLKLHFDSNLENLPTGEPYIKAPGENEFPDITKKNGVPLEFPIPDPQYRVISYQKVVGETVDGYAIPIPTIDGYAFRGWYTESGVGKGIPVTQLTVNGHREDWTVFAQWVQGLITVVFNAGEGPNRTEGKVDEPFRMVRYKGVYGKQGTEDVDTDYYMALPKATIPGRDFIGWYLEPEPKFGGMNPDEKAQAKMKQITDDTMILNKKSHPLYAHYKDHRYIVDFNPNLPINADQYGLRGQESMYGRYNAPPSYMVVYNQPFGKSWESYDIASPSNRGKDYILPDLNSSEYYLSNYYFEGWYLEPTFETKVNESTKVAACNSNSDHITLYARWIGKEKPVSFKSNYKPDPSSPRWVEDTVFIEGHENKDTLYRFTAPYPNQPDSISYYDSEVDPGDPQNESLDTLTPFPHPYLKGYNFLGWWNGWDSDKHEVSGEQVFPDPGKSIVDKPGRQTFHAKWEASTQKLVFDAKGGNWGDDANGNRIVKQERNIIYDSKYGECFDASNNKGFPADPEKPGYIFTGWYSTQTDTEGYNYRNSPAYIQQTDYFSEAPENKTTTLYAGWICIMPISKADYQKAISVEGGPDKAPSLFDGSEDVIPPHDGDLYGGPNNNIKELTVDIVTVAVPNIRGVQDETTGLWYESTIPYPVGDQTVNVSCNTEHGRQGINVGTGEFTSDLTGICRITTHTIKETEPGPDALLEIKAKNCGVGESVTGNMYYHFLGNITGVTLNILGGTGDVYVRNGVGLRATVTKERPDTNLHGYASKLSWSVDASSLGEDPSLAAWEKCCIGVGDIDGLQHDEWKTGTHALETTTSVADVVFRAGYTPSRKQKDDPVINVVKVSIKNEMLELEDSIEIEIKKPKELFAVPAGEYSKNFVDTVDALYTNSTEAKQKWCIDGFKTWEGGNPLQWNGAKAKDTKSFSPNTLNNTKHPIYLWPNVVREYANGNSSAEAGNRDVIYMSFPSNVTTIGTRNVGSPSDNEYSSIKEIYIAGKDVRIKDSAFCQSSDIDCRIKFGANANIGYVGNYSFYNCKLVGMAEDDFKGMKAIGDYAFAKAFRQGYAVNITSVSGNLGSYAFAYSPITKVTSSKTGIYAFKDCTSLSSVILQASEIAEGCFQGCIGLKSITDVSNVTVIKGAAFADCKNLGLYTFIDSLTEIEDAYNGKGAFENTALSSIDFANYHLLSSIGTRAFYNTPLTSFSVLNSGITSIGADACRSTTLTSINLNADNLSSIGNYAFADNQSSSNVYVDMNEYLTTLSEGVFYHGNVYCFRSSDYRDIGGGYCYTSNKLKYIGKLAFAGNNFIHVKTWADGVQIGESAFANNSSLQSATFDSVGQTISLGSKAFADCSKLQTLDFLALGSAFSSCRWATKDVWSGCDIQYIKVTKDNFRSSGYGGSGEYDFGGGGDMWVQVPAKITFSISRRHKSNESGNSGSPNLYDSDGNHLW